MRIAIATSIASGIASVVGVVLLTIAGPAHAAVDVVATVPDLAALVKEVGGNQVRITSLSLPTQDPHFVDAKPSLVLKLNKADLLVAVGLDLEVGWLPALQTSARNPRVMTGGRGYLECAQFVAKLDVPTGAVDRSAGDIHPGGNPHYLYDPRQAAACAKGIAARLGEIDRGNAATYQAHLKGFLARLATAQAGWERRMAAFKGRPVITYHKSWNHLLGWLGLVELATLEPKPGIPPSPRHVAEVLRLGREKGARVVLQESYYPDRTGRLVAKKLDGKVVVLAGGADVASGEGYIEHLDHLIDALEEALR
jgi:zinc/manganese transport system substrate-binding protein